MTGGDALPPGVISWLAQARAKLPTDVNAVPPAPLPPTTDIADHLVSIRDRARSWTAAPRPPLRGLYHLACTGGTVISQCLAALPNTQILSEVDPVSRMSLGQSFTPSNLIGLTHVAPHPSSEATKIKIFVAGLQALYEETTKTGMALILRAHSHSQFCYGPTNLDRPSLQEMVKDHYRLLSLVTVRHPLDSYLSLHSNGWVDFMPRTLEEYSRRYGDFLDHHEGIEILKYEDFIENPERQMQWACDLLELKYTPDFTQLFRAITLSGNSGRSGGTLGLRPRRSVPNVIAAEADESPAYKTLCKRLGYKV